MTPEEERELNHVTAQLADAIEALEEIARSPENNHPANLLKMRAMQALEKLEVE